MSDVEEMIAVRAVPAQAMRALLSPSRMSEWAAPDVSVTALTATERLLPGDRFRVEGLVGPVFEYQVEAATEREVVFSFDGPWRGEERWSFVADGADTIVRRAYSVADASGLGGLAWRTVGRLLLIAHFKLELSRLKDLLEREPGIRAEIEPPPDAEEPASGQGSSGAATSSAPPTTDESAPRRQFEIDEG